MMTGQRRTQAEVAIADLDRGLALAPFDAVKAALAPAVEVAGEDAIKAADAVFAFARTGTLADAVAMREALGMLVTSALIAERHAAAIVAKMVDAVPVGSAVVN